MSSEVTVTYLNIILYALSYQLQRPIEPFLVRSLIRNTSSHEDESTSNQTYGRLTSFFSFIQTIGSPLVGMLLDRIGPRRTSIIVYTASGCSYWMLAHATSPMGLYCSKVPTLFQHAFLVGQATVSCSFEEEEDEEENASSARRAAALGRMTTAYTIGATIGPALGGYLASTDLYAGARVAVVGSLLSVLLSIMYLKDHTVMHNKNECNDKASSKEENTMQKEKNQTNKTFLQSVRKTLSFLYHPKLGPLLIMKLINGISSSAFTTILPLILTNQLQFSPSSLGYFMSASSLSVAAFAAIGISPAMLFFGNSPDRLAFWGMSCRLVSLLLFGALVSHTLSINRLTEEKSGLVSNTGGLLAITLACVVISLASHVHATSLTTLTTGSVPPEDRGTVLGLEHGIFSMARIVGPPLGTTLLSWPSWFGNFGKVTIWGVVIVCIGLDSVVMMMLRVWSMRQYAKVDEGLEVCSKESYTALAKERNNHEHSD